jgi:hypothetical protein
VIIAAHLLHVLDYYDDDNEFKKIVEKVILGVEEEGETVRIYKQALICRLNRQNDLCIMPISWAKEMHK